MAEAGQSLADFLCHFCVRGLRGHIRNPKRIKQNRAANKYSTLNLTNKQMNHTKSNNIVTHTKPFSKPIQRYFEECDHHFKNKTEEGTTSFDKATSKKHEVILFFNFVLWTLFVGTMHWPLLLLLLLLLFLLK